MTALTRPVNLAHTANMRTDRRTPIDITERRVGAATVLALRGRLTLMTRIHRPGWATGLMLVVGILRATTGC